ncbi:unnamed protein product [Adineta steineri]|uniref:Ketosynthase family 3 (KS3) domain-containing protein n=1 Tax=Adineta steineri TaxID=433720 RepID=A0A814NQQ3_9BILA|nr:unnamed protein product [Adineta steineri]
MEPEHRSRFRGPNSFYSPENLLLNSITGAKSADGQSRSFSTDANGYAKVMENVMVIAPIVFFGDAFSSHNGNEDKTNFVVPSAVGQIRLLTNIYSRINFDAQRIFYIEAHGTGTPVSDPIEANCLGQFFNQSSLGPPLLIDSAKSNLGYTEGTAGVASLIKFAMLSFVQPDRSHFLSSYQQLRCFIVLAKTANFFNVSLNNYFFEEQLVSQI